MSGAEVKPGTVSADYPITMAPITHAEDANRTDRDLRPDAAEAERLTRELGPRTCGIWQTMLGLTLELCADPIPPATPETPQWSGYIALSGDWQGTIAVSCLEPAARQFAGAMFAMAADETSDAEIQDALGELANLVGGQTKQLLGDRPVIGLPVVIKGDFKAVVPHSHKMATLRFRTDGHGLEVAVVGADADGGRSAQC